VEGPDGWLGPRGPIDESKKDFWDSFGKSESSAIGTAAMRGNGSGGSVTKDDEWESW
jgi:hypothetical protein